MALTNVIFEVTEDGLGILAPNDDNISAILFAGAAPTAFGTSKIKAYTDIYAAVADGITSTSVTYGLAYYHISEFFRISKGATLYVGFGLTNVSEELYAASGGKVRQLGVFITDLATVESVHQANANLLAAKFAPLSIAAGYEPTVTPVVGDLPDMALRNAPNVSVVVFGDGSGRGAALAAALGKPYISAVGTVLGLMSKAAVHENIGWLQRFNMSDGSEFAAIEYVTGEAYSDGTTDLIDQKRYIVPRQHAGYGGTYIEKDHTATAATKDLSSIRNNRVIGKAIRLIRAALLPQLKSPLYVDTDGKLDADTVGYFGSLASRDLTQMRRDREVSNFGVYIDPNQNVLQTGRLNIDIRIIPVGSASEIRVKLGFTTSLSGF